MRTYRLEYEEAGSVGLPPGIYHSTDTKLLLEMWTKTTELELVADLRGYAATEPIPHLDRTIVPAIDFFCRHKGRDGKKIWEHITLGYGPKMKLGDRVWLHDHDRYSRDLCLGLGCWIEVKVPPIVRHPRTMRQYGVTDFRELAYDLISLVQHRWLD